MPDHAPPLAGQMLALVRPEIEALEARTAKMRELERLVHELDATESRDPEPPPAAKIPARAPAAAARKPPAAKPATSKPPTSRRPNAAAQRNETRVLQALQQNGEMPQGDLASRAGVPRGSITGVCVRLQKDGKLTSRDVPASNGSGKRRLWRLTDQPTKDDTYKSAAMGATALRDTHRQKRAEKEQAAQAAAGPEGTLRKRVLETLRQAGAAGLTMAHISAAVPGQERSNEIEAKVRELWNDGLLARRPDGTFVVASTRSWTAADREEVANAA